ncbi:hypothetical protein [Nocardiopsis composta]|uniref:LPXTG cell wall anchor domain-containing protein n=1 Tax=Nocardiopsis composta TaxID=157465 RepID=A0A7W8QPR3_9ACTN|nr:hypothetical protein [Nocardiopsis composta]MBB5434330.1 hypothetical protein [Nocardiopsis composta]
MTTRITAGFAAFAFAGLGAAGTAWADPADETENGQQQIEDGAQQSPQPSKSPEAPQDGGPDSEDPKGEQPKEPGDDPAGGDGDQATDPQADGQGMKGGVDELDGDAPEPVSTDYTCSTPGSEASSGPVDWYFETDADAYDPGDTVKYQGVFDGGSYFYLADGGNITALTVTGDIDLSGGAAPSESVSVSSSWTGNSEDPFAEEEGWSYDLDGELTAGDGTKIVFSTGTITFKATQESGDTTVTTCEPGAPAELAKVAVSGKDDDDGKPAPSPSPSPSPSTSPSTSPGDGGEDGKDGDKGDDKPAPGKGGSAGGGGSLPVTGAALGGLVAAAVAAVGGGGAAMYFARKKKAAPEAADGES